MPREPGPSDPEWRDTESSMRAVTAAKIAEDMKLETAEGIRRSAVANELDEQNLAVIRAKLDELAETGERLEVLKHFRFGHLKGPAAEVAKRYGLLAAYTVMACPPGEQRAFALQMLLCARDAAARTLIP